jgi:hypothetical protein
MVGGWWLVIAIWLDEDIIAIYSDNSDKYLDNFNRNIY